MGRNRLSDKYFQWMCQLVYADGYSKRLSYRKLFSYLNSVEFTYIIEMDENRAFDGIGLRYRFGYENGIDTLCLVGNYMDDHPCSVLEMMIALSIRCEEQIMDNPDIGNRTGQWFWNMIISLGLNSMDDSKFDIQYVEEVIQCFLNREYEYNGKGGLFTIPDCQQDMRKAEIWYQAMWYLDSVL
jgi:hypothetical protein